MAAQHGVDPRFVPQLPNEDICWLQANVRSVRSLVAAVERILADLIASERKRPH